MNKKEQIIKTATTLFVKQGFENTPTAQISKDSGVATGTLFYHYKTKEELINEIYLNVKKKMSEALLKNYNENLEIREQVKNLWFNLIKWGFYNKDENQFLQRFYGSTYINNLTYEQASISFKKSEKLFLLAKNNNLTKDISFELNQQITFSLYQSFLIVFYKLKKLDKKLLNLSFEIYWDAIGK